MISNYKLYSELQGKLLTYYFIFCFEVMNLQFENTTVLTSIFNGRWGRTLICTTDVIREHYMVHWYYSLYRLLFLFNSETTFQTRVQKFKHRKDWASKTRTLSSFQGVVQRCNKIWNWQVEKANLIRYELFPNFLKNENSTILTFGFQFLYRNSCLIPTDITISWQNIGSG